MKVFIHEYFCGGGFLDQDPDQAPIVEAGAMFRAAVESFFNIRDIDIFSLIDHRFKEKFDDLPGVSLVDADYRTSYGEALDRCDAALVIAPESGGELESHTASILFRGKINLGSGTNAIRHTGDKLIFWQTLTEAGIPTPKSSPVACFFEPSVLFSGKWLTKPVDGVGSEGVTLREDRARLDCPRGMRLMAQEYIEGEPMSISVISSKDHDLIVSLNRQTVARQTISDEVSLEYCGGEILAVDPDLEITNLVKKMKKIFPELAGYWGLDYINTDKGPVVIEINPRLTTSYVALLEALDHNPAELILKASTGGDIDVDLGRRQVGFGLDGVTTS